MPVIPFIPAIISGVGTVIGAHEAASGSKDAAKTQADSADKALAWQQQLYTQQRSDLAPYRNAGGGAVGQLAYGLGVPGFEGGPKGPKDLSVPPVSVPMAPGNGQPPQRSPMMGAMPPMAGGGGQVLLRNPMGNVKAFAPDDPALAHYSNLPGVQRVN